MKRLFPLLLAISLLLAACGRKDPEASISFASQDFSAVAQVQLRNAHNGIDTSISEPQAVQEICAFLCTVSGKEGASAKGWYEGTYSVKLLDGQGSPVFSIGFGDSAAFYYGEYGDGYPIRYLLDGLTIAQVTEFLAQYESSFPP